MKRTLKIEFQDKDEFMRVGRLLAGRDELQAEVDRLRSQRQEAERIIGHLLEERGEEFTLHRVDLMKEWPAWEREEVPEDGVWVVRLRLVE